MNKRQVNTLLGYYQGTSTPQRAVGRQWYGKTLRWLEHVTSQHIYPIDNVVCAFAALSPRISWHSNCRALVALLHTGDTHLGIPANTFKAKQLLWSDNPLAAIDAKGYAHKTLAFAQAILGDLQAVVLDTWMLQAMEYPNIKRRKAYEQVANSIRHAAALVGEYPSDFQAIVWLQVRKG